MKRTMAVRCWDCDRGNSGVSERADGDGKEVCGSLYWLQVRRGNKRGGGSKRNIVRFKHC